MVEVYLRRQPFLCTSQVVSCYILTQTADILDLIPAELMTYILLLKMDTLNIFWKSKSDGQSLTAKDLRQFVEDLQL